MASSPLFLKPWTEHFNPFDAIGFTSITLLPPSQAAFDEACLAAYVASNARILERAGIEVEKLPYSRTQIDQAVDFTKSGDDDDSGALDRLREAKTRLFSRRYLCWHQPEEAAHRMLIPKAKVTRTGRVARQQLQASTETHETADRGLSGPKVSHRAPQNARAQRIPDTKLGSAARPVVRTAPFQLPPPTAQPVIAHETSTAQSRLNHSKSGRTNRSSVNLRSSSQPATLLASQSSSSTTQKKSRTNYQKVSVRDATPDAVDSGYSSGLSPLRGKNEPVMRSPSPPSSPVPLRRSPPVSTSKSLFEQWKSMTSDNLPTQGGQRKTQRHAGRTTSTRKEQPVRCEPYKQARRLPGPQ
ncbi:uncharacterized protein B0I36DRAFT_408766 [Microdochium trichocladiopsis]|uniref:Uncharacterized protein n=1 Tax=Microdochium trichocladiopsis TaxID=1682393 RepID=A0A9P9BQ70_9PEZI|nr:uncharacterized protein B0I36DRAFT_408766 [Microdochium trichocladiopsis]KAH7030632.1 hypothetical protein B0I36DRAFT_408766 [Microdochium trichocladiopsis]